MPTTRGLNFHPALGRPEREVAARPVADALSHTLAASLLLAEGQIRREQREALTDWAPIPAEASSAL